VNQSTIQKKFESIVPACEVFELSVSLDKCVVMEMSWKTRSMENIKYNNHVVKSVENFKYARSRIVTNGNVKE
jgi:predicted fused transcriptional regulator/phosphomethylpyrimidine kinase